MDSSTSSRSSAKLHSKFILRDTMGPTEAARAAINDSENSSSISSIKDLSAVDEKGLSRSSWPYQGLGYSLNGNLMQVDQDNSQGNTDQRASAKLQTKLILRDTMGPTQAVKAGMNDSENSSNTSSSKELSAVDEKGQNRSFRAIQVAKYGTNPVAMDSAGLRTEPLRRLEEYAVDRGTPSSTASSHSGRRVVYKKGGGKAVFIPGNLQDNHPAQYTSDYVKDQREPPATTCVVGDKESNLGHTTRDFLRGQRKQPESNHSGNALERNLGQTTRDFLRGQGKQPESNPLGNALEEMPIETPEKQAPAQKNNDSKKTIMGRCWSRCAILGILIGVLVAAIALVITFGPRKEGNSDSYSGNKTEQPEPDCPNDWLEFNANDSIAFNCTLKGVTVEHLRENGSILIFPPNEETLIYMSNQSKFGWHYSFDQSTSQLEVFGPAAESTDSGNYTLSIKDRNTKKLYSDTFTIQVLKLKCNENQEVLLDNQIVIYCKIEGQTANIPATWTITLYLMSHNGNGPKMINWGDEDEKELWKYSFKSGNLEVVGPNASHNVSGNYTLSIKTEKNNTLNASLTLTVYENECPIVQNIPFQEPIAFSCMFKRDTIQPLSSIHLFPPRHFENGSVITISEKNGNLWTYSLNESTGELKILGPSARCSSTGTYRMLFWDNIKSTLRNITLKLEIISEVSKVNVSLSQDDFQSGTKQFKFGCSTNSGCQQAFVEFFVVINEDEVDLKGVNFKCTIEYDDYSGYSVACEGTIPDFLLQQFTSIICRPRSTILGDNYNKTKELEQELELKECNITNNCGYKCEGFSEEYYAVDQYRCDIFHRCYGTTVYSSFCPSGTFFNPEKCSCDHTRDLDWCRADGLNYDISGKNETWCDASMKKTF